jgi:hypothetical protein
MLLNNRLHTIILLIVMTLFFAGCQDMQSTIKDRAQNIAQDVKDSGITNPSHTDNTQDMDTTQGNDKQTDTSASPPKNNERPWENIDCSLSNIPAPPGGAGDASGWTKMTLPDTGLASYENALTLKKGSTGRLFALGAKGTLLDLDEKIWKRIDTPVDVNLNDIWYSSWPSYIVGDNGTVFSYSPITGTAKIFESPVKEYNPRPDLEWIWGDNSERFWVLSAEGFFYYRRPTSSDADYDATNTSPRWYTLSLPVTPASIAGPYGERITDIEVFSYDNVVALIHSPMGYSYTIKWDGKEWSDTQHKIEPEGNALVRNIWGFSSSDMFSVGVSGTVMHFDGAEWRPFETLGLDRFNSYSDIWGTSKSDLYVVGDYDPQISSSPICHFDGSRWKCESSKVENLRQIIGNGNGKGSVYASSSDGEIIHYVEGKESDELSWFSYKGEEAYLIDSYAYGDEIYYLFYNSKGTHILNKNTNRYYEVTQEELYIQPRAIAVDDTTIYAVGEGFTKEGDTFSNTGLGIIRVDKNSGEMTNHKIIDDESNAFPREVEVDGRGNIFIGGEVSGDFLGNKYSGMSEVHPTALRYDPYSFDSFILKINKNNEVIWSKVMGVEDIGKHFSEKSGEQIQSIVFHEDALYFGGNSPGNDGFPGTEIKKLSGLGFNGTFFFVGKLDADTGELIKGYSYGTKRNERIYDLQFNEGKIYVTASSDFGGEIDGQNGRGQGNTLIIQLDSNLETKWIRYIYADSKNTPSSSITDKQGNLYVTGISASSIGGRAFSGGTDIFVMKLSPKGVILSTVMMGTPNHDYSYDIQLKGNKPFIWVGLPNYPNKPADAYGGFWTVSDMTTDPYAECR